MVLLLTATIDPGATILLARRDPSVRLRDYQQALGTWVSTRPTTKVVFGENSGHDFATLAAIAAGSTDVDVEFVSFAGNQSGPTRGKGHAEMGILQHVFEGSRLIRDADIVVKCTGRLTVRNAANLFEAISRQDFDVMCTLKNYLAFADSRIFAATPDFFRDHLFPTAAEIDDRTGITFEHALAHAVAASLRQCGRWRPFPHFPVIEGVSGTDDVTMTNSFSARALKRLYHRVRNFVYAH